MTWAKLDDTFIDDPDLLALPRGVRLLYVESIVWSCKHTTDGALPRHVLSRITDEPDLESAIALLVAAEFWDATPAGFTIRDFLLSQTSRKDDDDRRAETAFRKERSRRHIEGDHSYCLQGRYCSKGTLSTAQSQVLSRDRTRDRTRGVTSDRAGDRTPPSPDQPDQPVPTVREGAGGRLAEPRLAPSSPSTSEATTTDTSIDVSKWAARNFGPRPKINVVAP